MKRGHFSGTPIVGGSITPGDVCVAAPPARCSPTSSRAPGPSPSRSVGWAYSSILLVVARIVGFLEGPVTGFIWIPIFELEAVVGLWLLVKGVSAQAGPWARVSLDFAGLKAVAGSTGRVSNRRARSGGPITSMMYRAPLRFAVAGIEHRPRRSDGSFASSR